MSVPAPDIKIRRVAPAFVMPRSQLFVIVVVIALAVGGYLYLTPQATAPTDTGGNGSTQSTPSDPKAVTGAPAAAGTGTSGVSDNAGRTLVARPSERTPAASGTNVLRVIFADLTDETAALADIRAATYDIPKQRTARIRESWSSQGKTNEFGLDDYLARVTAQYPEQRFDELKVIVEHPLFLRETISIPAAAGVKTDDGQTVYEARVTFAEVVYWPALELSVRDAATKQHLEDVELRFVPTAFMGLHQQPGKDGPFSILGSGLASPITLYGGRKAQESEALVAGISLQPEAGASRRPVDLYQPEENARGVMVYARAPGYAWGRIVIDLSKGNERELLLQPSTTLNVRFTNVQLAEYVKLDKPATDLAPKKWTPR